MTIVELLSDLRAREVNLWLDGGKLRFDAPTAALTDSLRQELARRKGEIVAFLRQAGAGRRSSAPRLVPRPNPEGGLPASFAQQRLWFLDQLEPGSSAYNVFQAFRLAGWLDVAALERSLGEIVARHGSLRTTFATVDGRPVQCITQVSAWSLPLEDLSGFSESEREVEVRRVAEEEIGRPFDLGHGPLFRVILFRLAPTDHVLLVTMHHIVSDGWSLGVFRRELRDLYAAYSAGRESPLEELPVQYGDFAVWQREWLSGEVLEEEVSFWRRQLTGAPSLLELPTDRPRPPAQSFRGAGHSILFSKSLTEGLRELSRREGATLYMTLLAAFQALLVRYTGQEDIVVGSPIANRTRVEIEGLIGFFVNTLVLRTDLSGDPTFRELLKRVREIALGAYAHQDLPFEKLVEELRPERNLGQNPLFQVSFALENAPACSFELAGLEVIPLPVGRGTTHFDLEVYVGEKPGGLTCTFVYATDLFDAETIVRMMGHYQTLLEGIVTDANRRVSEVAIITEPERRQVVEEWNQTEREYPREKTVHGLFEEQAERTPGAEAVVFGRERLSYGELNERANRLARYLRKRGVGPEVLVGLCVERSLEMVVGLLGILKAGGAYLPLDPGYPQQRVGFMLQDSGARVVLTQESLSGSLAEGGFERVCLDSDWPEIARESADNPKPLARPDNLAYVIYTSGSTGTPKGVEIEHHSTVALLAWTRQLFSNGELGGVLASTSVCFDLSVFELFAPLAWGGKVIVSRDALELPELPSAEEVKLINTVPSAMAELLRIGALPESVSTINLAGEPLTASLVNEILRSGAGRQVFDLYGPTEDTTYSTCARRSAEGPVTIGRPISNKRVYLLDGRLQPVPIGVAGDLYVAGAGVARGYLNRPEMTAEKFLADPFREGGERMYRTGDRGRFLSDGQIQFLGRTDHQVKIRGYRIEVGEIEQALARNPEIQACIVTAREEPSGDKRLVGYIVPRNGSSPSVTQLRGFLKSTLPDYMVPSAFLFLDALPLTPNGKVDRRALPAPKDGRPELEDVFIAPRTPIEETVAGIWCQVLGLEKVGVHDNFFDLGGHSLLAVQLVAKIEKLFGRQVALATIFRAPTVGELAQMFGEGRRKERRLPSLVAIQPKGTRPPFFCVHANTGIVYYRGLARLLGPDQPFYGLQSQGLDGGRAPYETVEEMAAHYVSEVRAVQPQGPYYLGGHSFGGKVAFEMARQLRAQGQRTAFLAFLDTFNIPIPPRPTRLEIARERTRVHLAALRTGGRRERLTYLLARAETLRSLLGRALSRGYEVLFQPLRRAQRRVLDANTRAARRYVASYYEGKATIFRATDRTKDFRDRLRTYPLLGWEKLCSEGVDVHEVPGGHSSLMEEEANLKALAEKLRACLREAWTAESAETAARPGRRVNAAAEEA